MDSFYYRYNDPCHSYINALYLNDELELLKRKEQTIFMFKIFLKYSDLNNDINMK